MGKEKKRQENRVVSERFPLHFTAGRKPAPQRPRGERALDGYSLQSAATHREANLHRYTALPPLVKAAGKKCVYARPIVVGLLWD